MDESEKIINTANLLLEISSLLMVSGANTNRTNLSIDRFASVLNFKASSMISHKTIIMTLEDEETNLSCTRVQNLPPYAINFTIISEISKASWNAISDNWTLEQIANEIERIKHTNRYPRIIILIAVSLAGAGFCNIFKGDYINMLVAFVSTFMGLFIFQETHKIKYNLYLRIFSGAFVASSVASVGILYHIGEQPQSALATSILFLVPGVALINSFTDLLENNMLNGIVRFTHGLMTVLAMAIGLFLAMYLFQIK
ncbi:threonine/serine exporter family protein [Yeosuana sp.]|uniref:threonine/serine exporter family protein n=1 Tax=Yeosuana sp. TaxID=2529388 RepID=UPI00405522A6|tara:strand:- start:2774 stop:3541 length:768 start_codon:yes stop_codon:yes gene_type:complete